MAGWGDGGAPRRRRTAAAAPLLCARPPQCDTRRGNNLSRTERRVRILLPGFADSGVCAGSHYDGWEQTNTVVTGIQQPSCLATLRVDQRSAGDGCGNRPAVPVRIGSKTALSMSGVAGSFGAMAIGFPAATAVPIANWGLTSFEQALPIVVITYSPLDLPGELVTALDVPISMPTGITLMAQGLMLAPGTQLLTNPVKFILVP